MTGRTCEGCGLKSTPTLGAITAFVGAYWHRRCFVASRKADGPAARGASRKRRPPSPSDRPPVGDEPGSLLDRLEET